jgi:hypothetical protein
MPLHQIGKDIQDTSCSQSRLCRMTSSFLTFETRHFETENETHSCQNAVHHDSSELLVQEIQVHTFSELDHVSRWTGFTIGLRI